MTLDEARKVLGLSPGDDPLVHLQEFRAARERIAEMVRTAPNDNLAIRYQEGLEEFDRALAALRESLEIPKAEPARSEENVGGSGGMVIEPPPIPPIPQNLSVEAGEEAPVPVRSGNGLRVFAWGLVLLVAAGGGFWIYQRMEEDKRIQLKGRIAYLERQGAIFIENRRWEEARESYRQIEELDPNSDLVGLGRRSIEAGMDEEQKQFLGYWSGEALAALDTNRLDDAQKAVEMILSKFPGDASAKDMQKRIEQARSAEKLQKDLELAKQAYGSRDWEGALKCLEAVLKVDPKQAEALQLQAEVMAGKKKAEADLAKAKQLYTQAKAQDQGKFNAQALAWLREASALAPGDPEITALLEKMASYTRTLKVPGDYRTPAEALANANERDRIVIEAGQWPGPLLIDKEVELQGAGSDKTIFECGAEVSSVLTVGPGAKGARFTGMTFRHRNLDPGSERYAAVLVRGGQAAFTDCHFLEAAGHGLDVVAGGSATAMRCRFTGNGWDGLAASGEGTVVEVRDSEASGNFEHGLDLWGGAKGQLTGNRCEGNGRNGILMDAKAGAIAVNENQLRGNREFGLVLSSGGSGAVKGNQVSGNLLGGIVVRMLAAKLEIGGNKVQSEGAPALVLEKGVTEAMLKPNEWNGPISKEIDFNAPPSP